MQKLQLTKEETNKEPEEKTNKEPEPTPASFRSKYLVALEVALAAVPIFGAVITGGLYILPRLSLTYFLPLEWYSIIGGGISTFVVWLILALFVSPFTTVDRADVSQYNMLNSRLGTLQSHLQHVKEQEKIKPLLPEQQEALKVSDSCEESIKGMLNRRDPGLHWLLGKGYLSLWRTFHHAEEALMETEAPDTLFGEALRDRLRIQDAHMSNSEELLRELTEAVEKIAPAAHSYMEKNRHEQSVQNPTSGSQTIDTWAYREASITIREVRRVFNEFKDSSWEGLLALRNNLLIATVLAGNATYLLLSLSIITNVRKDILVMGLAFYLVGALAGLFGRFYGETDHTFHSRDYGLSITRLVATPLFSGLAGVGGTLITAILPIVSGHEAPVPVNLENVFQAQPLSLFIAAAFGLTPNLIMRALKQQAEAQRPPDPEGHQALLLHVPPQVRQ